ncbi:LysR family transcriptional regulator [Pseudoxanthomonas sp.]|uniref:LysR family transcriptional regulator n=1 Tax=Pseudoxanthomonas sp. TaxID=1871049 RepID=UPI002626F9C0|nr:LysR family transcriptional regulator [Pseudoxanthomonas sp.]WDS37217.1 MAG: LysR family transcriptional regulator [Pseudoxanthomonas sp.]
MELRHVRYFLLVAEELNFTRAAARAGIGQPPLSQQIRVLEEEIGAPLFLRTPKGAELTEAGQAFLPEAQALLAQADVALGAARRGGRGQVGSLRIGFTASAAFIAAVPEAIRRFTSEHADVAVSLAEAATSELLERLHQATLDVALVRLGRNDPDELDAWALLDEPMRIAVPLGHRLAGRASAPLSALAGESLVLFPRTAGPGLFDEVIACCWQAGLEPVMGQEAPQFSTAVNLVAAGLGVSLVPASMAQVQVTGVDYLRIEGVAPTVRLAVCTRPGEHGRIVPNFVQTMRTCCEAPGMSQE